ncbi:Pnap_2097 family protein [Ancylobacter lacus]|uniref:Pnap_2097 family protein n=1 Tax=Ancylobacter lacus TaxID=2579970 RepID=UPI001BCD42F3|nr:Pnap_2097 family protein [Ancylobacter lacus]MBS7539022.1 hypothetical protein [Ancylobacter lacus]
MTIALPLRERSDESPATALERAPPALPAGRIVLGMPHLSLGGLAETWLLKELGHRHWQMLAALAGRAVPDFRDEHGAPCYAAFCGVSVREAAFGRLREHDVLTLASRIARVSRTQFTSLHSLARDGEAVGTVELASVFVKRGEPGRNRSIARVALDLFPPPGAAAEFGGVAALAARLRAPDWDGHFGFVRAEGRERGRVTINPCPAQDFNGADFLYFASFQAFVDRAEWELFGRPRLTTAARDIVFHGNVEIGDTIAVVLMGERATPAGLDHWFRLERASDGARLADVFSRREEPAAAA